MDFGLLGPVAARSDGRDLPLGGPKQRALLAILLLHRNEAVSRDRLIDGLWGERPPPTAAHTLDNYVSRLRKAVGDERLTRRPPGYVLRVGPDELDLDRFERQVEEGRAALARGNANAAAATLRDALALWRGPALADVVYEPFASAHAEQLEARRLAALEDRIEADLAQGGSSELIVELEALVREHPLRERLLAQLMLALYRSGRQAAALETYRTARRELADDLGLEPGPQLQDLERRILEHDPSLGGPAPKPSTKTPQRSMRRGSLVMMAGASVAVMASVVVGIVIGIGGTTASDTGAAAESQLVRVSAGSGRLGPHAQTGAPSAIAADAGSLWVADTASNAVLRVNPSSGDTVDRIPLSAQPGHLAVGGGAVWVAGTAGAAVTRIDTATDQITQTIPVGSNPSDICYCAGAVWVSETVDDALLRIDPITGTIRHKVSLATQPSALAAGAGSLWVASYGAGTVTRVSARSNASEETVHVGQGPSALAFAAGALWVANKLDGTVSRIDPQTASVTQTIPTGSAPAALAFERGSLWVANQSSRTLSRINAARGSVDRTVNLTGEPTSLASARDSVWAGMRPLVSHHGGTLVLLDTRRFGSVDAQVDYEATAAQFLGLVNDGLVAYDHTAGADGFQLVPDLALSLPIPSDGGRTYLFRLRPGIRYSDGDLVRASDIARGARRLFRVHSPVAGFFTDLIGGRGCAERPQRCRLAQGVVADDIAGTVSFHLQTPDPDFLFKLALGFMVPIQPGTPMHDIGTRPIRGTGPYKFAKVAPRELVFVRNPRFHEWSHAAQPDGNPDRLEWRFGLTADQEIRAVANGQADWTGDFPPDLDAVARRYASELRSNAFPTTLFVQINTHTAPFDDVRVRRALNYAVDRAAIARMYGGAIANTPTCQVIPPGLPGYRRYCPYTLDPRADGRWAAPDLARARTLVAASRTRGAHVTIWSISDNRAGEPAAPYIARVLRHLGYHANVRVISTAKFGRTTSEFRQSIQLQPVIFGPDYPSASEIFELFLACHGALTRHHFCDSQLDQAARRGETLRLSAPRRSAAIWRQLDRELVDRAVWLPLVNQRIVDFVSGRLHNYEFSPVYHFLPAQAWLR